MSRSRVFMCTLPFGCAITGQPAVAQQAVQAQAPATSAICAPSTNASSSPTCRTALAAVAAPATRKPATAPKHIKDQDRDGTNADEIVVVGKRLDAARDSISPALGASDYTFTRATLDKQPGGPIVGIDEVLLQAPGVSRDGNGSIHVRNEHGNVQYRLDGVIIPESISSIGETFDQRIASSIDLLTGPLPAQYSYSTSGVVNLKTRSGKFENGGELGINVGSRNTLSPSAMIQGSTGTVNYYFSGSSFQSDMGIENPLPTRNAIHDHTRQYRAFGFLSDILSDTSRLSVFGGTSIGKFHIPNRPGIDPSFTVNGVSSFDSSKLDQRQREATHYGVLAYQYGGPTVDLLIAPFVRYAGVRFSTDPNNGDIGFNGFSDTARSSSLVVGLQADGSTKIGSAHIVRFGLFAQNDRTRALVTSRVLPGTFDDAFNFTQTSDQPLTIVDRSGRNGQLYGAYVQDEWTLSPKLTLNYGARFDAVRAYTREQQFSPRLNLVWFPTKSTTFHIGYARNLTPAPQEIIEAPTLALFNDTAKEPQIKQDDPVHAEREHYFDAGIEHRFPGGFKLALDSYYKLKHNLLDEGQFGSGIVQSPYNYAKGYVWGVELSANYTKGPFDFYANIARGEAKGKKIKSSQFFFAPETIKYTQDHYIFTDHSQKWTASGGGSAKIRDTAGTVIPTFDFLYGDGLRRGDPAGLVPNGGKLPHYFVVDAGIVQNITNKGPLNGFAIRVDVVNLFDESYLLRDGSGVGTGAPQYGQRRGIFAGITKKF